MPIHPAFIIQQPAMKHIFILSLCVLLSANTIAQSVTQAKDLQVYPVRVGHKWGYAKFYGTFADTLITPRYDYIGDIHLPWNTTESQTTLSPYRLFEIAGKVGLLDNYLNEFIPNQYNRIRPISEQYFAVEKDDGFQLVNHKQETLFDGARYDDIKGDRSDDKLQFFLVKKDQKWAIKNREGETLVDHKYAAIQSAGSSGFFKVKYKLNESLWLLINSTGKPIFQERYQNVVVLDKRIIAIKKEGSFAWKYFMSSGNTLNDRFVLQEGEYSRIKKVSNHLLSLVPYDSVLPKNIILRSLNGDCEVINTFDLKIVGGKKSKRYVPDFFPLGDNYAVQSVMVDGVGRQKINYQVIDSIGEIRSSPYDTITASLKENLFLVARDYGSGFSLTRKWGILEPRKGVVLKPKTVYSAIFDFEDDIAVTLIGDNYGAIAVLKKKTDELPCIFESIFKSGERSLQVQTTDEKAVMYQLSNQGKFETDVIVSNTIVFSENAKRKIVEAESKRLKEIKRLNEPEYDKAWGYLNFTQVDGKLAILNKGEVVHQTDITDVVDGVVEIKTGLLAIHYKNKATKNKASQVFMEGAIEHIAFFDTEQNKVLNDFPVLGFRPFVKGYHYTTFIDEYGKMGLVNMQGQQLKVNNKPLRYLYIGPFEGGRARVCIGDRLVVDKKGELELPPKYTLGTVDVLKDEFSMQAAGKVSYGSNNDWAVYSWADEGSCQWGYIDAAGKLIVDTKYDHAEDFNVYNNRAIVFKTLSDKSGLKPKAGFGLIDKNGRKVLSISDDLLNIEYKNLRGDSVACFQITVGKTPTFYFNKKGQQVFVNPTRMRPFSEGLALFRSTDNKWGYVDSTGHIRIEARFEYARPFSDGLALVVDETGYCSFIDQKGKLVFKTRFTKKKKIGIGDFHNGRCWFKGTKGWFWGCFDKQGNEIIRPRFYYKITAAAISEPAEAYALPMDYINGVATVQMLNDARQPAYTVIDLKGEPLIDLKKYATIGSVDAHGIASYTLAAKPEKGLLNINGKELTKAIYTFIGTFENGYAKIKSKNEKWGLIDTTGKVVLRPTYKAIGLASEGLVPVQMRNSRGWYFVNMKGKRVIKGPFKTVTPFQNGISYVNYKGDEILIDKSDNVITLTTGKPLFFSEGILGMVKNPEAKKRNRLYFYADESGNNILGRDFAEITPFQLGIAKVRRLTPEVPGAKKRRELLGAINKRGVMVVPPKFRNLHLQPDGNIVINPQRYYGLVSVDGKTLLEPIYDLISYYPRDRIIRVEQGEKVGYAELKNDEIAWIWELGN